MRMTKLVAALAVLAFTLPALAQQEEGSGEYACQIAPRNPLHIPPGIYAYNARKLADFFGETKGARTIFAMYKRAHG